MASSSDDQDALTNLGNLARLSQVELASVDEADLIQGAQQAEYMRVRTPEISGQLLAELYRRGHSWPAIAKLTGIPQTTAFRRSEPYLP